MAPKSAAQKKLEARLRNEKKLTAETQEESEIRREKQRIQKRNLRAEQTSEKAAQRLVQDRDAKRRKLDEETAEKHSQRITKMKERTRMTRSEETLEKHTQRIAKVKERTCMTRSKETPKHCNQRQNQDKEKTRIMRSHETGDKREKRQNQDKEKTTITRSEETPEKREKRQNRDKITTVIARSEETPDKREKRQNRDKVTTGITRSEETPDKREKRQNRDKVTTGITRSEETEDQSNARCKKVRESLKILRQKKRFEIPSNDTLVADFLNKVRDAADYVCCACHRMMYRLGVQLLKEGNYTKASKSVLYDVLSFKVKSANDKEWICLNCHVTLKRGKMPVQAKCNNLELAPLPTELTDLNDLEIRMISQRIPFVKMVALPSGKQHGIHGPAVNVPAKLDFICTQFPRLPSETQLVPMKLKRRLKYKSYYMYDYVQPEKVLAALRWLKANNKHYAEIVINDKWLEDSTSDDPDLWNAMTKPDKPVGTDENATDDVKSESKEWKIELHGEISCAIEVDPCETVDQTITIHDVNTVNECADTVESNITYEILSASQARSVDNLNDTSLMNVDEPTTSAVNLHEETMENSATYDIVHASETMSSDNSKSTSLINVNKTTTGFERLHAMSEQKGMYIVDVPADGDCLFASVIYHLKKLGLYSGTTKQLRCHLAKFMEDNPICSKDGSQYRDFLAARIRSNDLLNADTEQPNEEHNAIAMIDDMRNRKEVQWVTYLADLESGHQWGEHLALKALAEMFMVKINVLATENPDMEPILPVQLNPQYELNVGLIQQYHYVALEGKSTMKILTDSSVKSTTKNVTQDTNTINKGKIKKSNLKEEHAKDREEQMMREDENAFEEASKVRGLPSETSLIRDNPDLADKEISFAPAEHEKPLPLLSDTHFEELANPDKYPDGRNALTADRPKKIDARRYFNQRLLDVDGRFAKSIEYLLSAQYATESKQIYGNINHFAFRRVQGRQYQGKKITAGLVKDASKMRELVRADHAYKLFKNVRGSPAYYQTLFYDVLAMMRQLGLPTWFFTVSAADMQWPDLLQTISRQYGTILSDDDVKNLSYQERTRLLRSNPVTAARHFQYRLELLFKDVLKSKAHPLGEIIDYVIRIEFQARGSPHAHTVLWVKNAPTIDVDTDEEVCDFIDKHMSCALPVDDPTLCEIVKSVQKHSHSAYCRKKGSCRFKFPRPPCTKTLLAREPDDDEESEEKQSKAQTLLLRVHDVLTDADTPTDISMEDLLSQAKTTEEEYMNALSYSKKGNNVVLQRTPAEQCINGYNPTILKAWQANIDVQYILDAYACVMYIAAYMTKSEQAMGELLKQVSKECRDDDIRSKLKRLGSVFLNNREVSAQEAAYRILSLPMQRKSRTVLFVNTDPKSERVAVLKPSKDLEHKHNDDEDIFQKNIVIRYAVRPDSLEGECLATFASNYNVSYNDNHDDIDDSAPQVLEDDDDTEIGDRRRLPAKITLKDGSGKMYKRKREAVIRFRKFNIQKEKNNYYRAKLMLYFPWRNEDTDLLADYTDFESHYRGVLEQIITNEEKFNENMELIDDAIAQHADNGPPEHAWASIAPETEHRRIIDEVEGTEVLRDMEQEDLDANAAMFQNPRSEHPGEISARYDGQLRKDILQPKEYRSMVRGLNVKQREVVFYHRRWCKDAVHAIKMNKPITPYRLFLSGPGGVGKSHVIRLIHTDTRKLLPLSNTIKPSDLTVLLTAPTGVAAFNIEGMTIHSALLLHTQQGSKDSGQLSFEKLNSLRSKFENLHLLIIDEVSMVGADMLLNIHRRLDEIKGISGDNIWFGNVSVLAVGDLYQLPPVAQHPIYEQVSDPMARLHGSGSIWKDEFCLAELDEIMRQKNDQSFAELLCRVRTGQSTDEDIETLKSREIDVNDPNYPGDILHVFAYNNAVNSHNKNKLNMIASKEQQVTICSFEDGKDSTGLIDLTKMKTPKTRNETGGLERELIVAVGARVMMTMNVDTADGLVNGVTGEVVAIKWNDADKVSVILVKFDNIKVGQRAIEASQWKIQYPNAVPVSRHQSRYDKANRKGATTVIVQFPLTLAWAVTIHKCQGLTMDQVVVSLKGGSKLNCGQAYVAFSRVKSLSGLYIINFDEGAIKTNPAINMEMLEMSNNMLPPQRKPALLGKQKPEWLTVGHLNIRYFLEKVKDLTSPAEMEIYHATDVMCFTETYLTHDHNIQRFLDVNNFLQFRQDIPNVQDHQDQHGVLICASARLNPKELTRIKVDNLESKVVVIETSKSKLVICAVYRKPSLNMNLFENLLDELLQLLPEHVPTIILGDFNDNLISDAMSRLVRFMCGHGYKQYVSRPTTDNGSIIDHIYFNRDDDNAIIDVHDVYYSDHDAALLTINSV